MYEVGDKVVYPHHGEGTVVRKELRDGREYLTIEIVHSGMTVMIPSDSAERAGLRKMNDGGDGDPSTLRIHYRFSTRKLDIRWRPWRRIEEETSQFVEFDGYVTVPPGDWKALLEELDRVSGWTLEEVDYLKLAKALEEDRGSIGHKVKSWAEDAALKIGVEKAVDLAPHLLRIVGLFLRHHA